MATEPAGLDLRAVGAALTGEVVLPADEGWDQARQAWNLAVDQRPVAVVYPESVDDVVATVEIASVSGLRIAFNAGGHNSGPIDWTEDTLLLKTERMRGIQIDAQARRARVEAGVLGKPLAGVLPAAARAPGAIRPASDVRGEPRHPAGGLSRRGGRQRSRVG
jgi:FAD/FMN-containing dehydrogenase